MGWQDRSYYRDSGRGAGNPFMWLLTGSVPLFTAFGIRVRAHATLLVAIVLVLLLGWGQGTSSWQDRVIGAMSLFLIVLLHEFGHCFAARSVGGSAEDIVMHPLGGLAMAQPPRRPWPTFVTVAGGPLVNVIICVIAGLLLFAFYHTLPWNPFVPQSIHEYVSFASWGRWVWWIYWTSWMLLAFNLLPIYPLDGGQMLQSILWPKFGYYRSMMFAAVTGIIAAIIAGMIAIATLHISLAILAGLGVFYCVRQRRMLLAEGPYGFSDETDYSASTFNHHDDPPKHRKLNKRRFKRAQKREAEERDEQDRVDQILAKVSAHGMNSLTFWEKRSLKKATERQRKRETELHEEMGRKGF